MARYVDVLLPIALDAPLSYRIEENNFDLRPGSVVQVPFRRGKEYGVVTEFRDEIDFDPSKAKPIDCVVDHIHLSENDLAFIKWMAKYTMNPAGMILKLFLSNKAGLEPPQARFDIIKNKTVEVAGLTKRQHEVYEQIGSDDGFTSVSEICDQFSCSRSIVDVLLDKKALVLIPSKTKLQTPDPNFKHISYSDAQQGVIKSLKEMVMAQKYSCALLDGVTGSGKTEVYFEAIAKALEQGQQSVVLVPEISLTPQWLERFEARFGVRPAQWHSQLTPAMRRDHYQAIASGAAKVVVGARSALFLPYANLGCIILDEEHEGSYKQEDQVIYHARDMAVARAHHLDIPVMLVSATPSLESMQNALTGRYQHLKLHERHGKGGFPDMSLVDLREHTPEKSRQGQPQWISDPMLRSLKETYDAGDQSLLFLNRRGYAPLTLCGSCGERLSCPNCTAWLVEHQGSTLHCHHCDFFLPKPKACKACGEEDVFVACGPGVQRIEEEVQRRLPGARTLVMASDAFEGTPELLEAIAGIQAGAYDVIIGTQMMAKGHNFPKLTYVGVIDADLGLSGSDLRASERTYQLLQQVSGRCGRADKKGQVMLQTYNPEHPVLQALIQADRDAFFKTELEHRERAMMPPFSRLAAVIVSSKNENQVRDFVKQLRRQVPSHNDVMILGPVTAPLAILRKYHRWRFLLRAPKTFNMQGYIQSWLAGAQVPSTMKIQIDIDPINFM